MNTDCFHFVRAFVQIFSLNTFSWIWSCWHWMAGDYCCICLTLRRKNHPSSRCTKSERCHSKRRVKIQSKHGWPNVLQNVAHILFFFFPSPKNSLYYFLHQSRTIYDHSQTFLSLKNPPCKRKKMMNLSTWQREIFISSKYSTIAFHSQTSNLIHQWIINGGLSPN